MQAIVQITDLDLVNTTAVKAARLEAAIEACAEYTVHKVEYMRVSVVSVNDPNPANVHAVLDACAAIGIVLG